MNAINTVGLVYLALNAILLVFSAWAFVSCLRTRPDAFPAIGRRSKGLWAVLTGLAAFYALGGVLVAAAPTGLFAIAATVITAVYMLDIRPKIKEITGGR